jgi:hypothetical protein
MACGVAVVPNAKKWARKKYRRRHGHTKLTVSGHLHCWLLLSYDRTWKNMVQTCTNWYQTNVEQCLWHEEKQTRELSHLVVQNVIMVWDTSWWCRAHIEQNMKSCNRVLRSVPNNMWRQRSETWTFANILKFQQDSWTFFRFSGTKYSTSILKLSFLLFTIRTGALDKYARMVESETCSTARTSHSLY